MTTRAIRRLCVFCGSKSGRDPAFAAAATGLGRLLARRQIELLYGGGSVGLMGLLADAVLQAGGFVQGVIPHVLARQEVMHPAVQKMHVVNTMHERKALMAELADAFLVLPGGYGTLEELFEVVTWLQLGIHHKPIGLLDVAQYFEPLVQFLAQAENEEFITGTTRSLLMVDTDPERILVKLTEFEPPHLPELVSPQQI